MLQEKLQTWCRSGKDSVTGSSLQNIPKKLQSSTTRNGPSPQCSEHFRPEIPVPGSINRYIFYGPFQGSMYVEYLCEPR